LSSNFGIVQVNPDVIETLEEAGLKFVGKDESGKRMEVFFPAWIGF
jgi:CTP synthase (UTP-ammonia lyase)